jgi:hypothetical protein
MHNPLANPFGGVVGHQRAHCSVTLQLARAARVFDDHDGV